MPSFEAMFTEELTALGASTVTKVAADADTPFVTEVGSDLAGIALSGGGIRSATFNLGLLQGLEQLGVLPLFDYLSTVSGGGYIGGFWSAWRKRRGNGKFPADDLEPHEIRHLREFSRFLAPRWGLFEIETWQFFGALATAILPMFMVGLAVIALAIWFDLGVTSSAFGARSYVLLGGMSDVTVAEIVVAVIALLVLVVFEIHTFRQEYPSPWKGEHYPLGVWLAATLLAVVVPLLVVHALDIRTAAWRYFQIFPGEHARWGDRLPFFAPAIGWAAAMVVLIFIRTLLSPLIREPRQGFYRAALDRTIGRLLGLTIFWSVMLLFLFAAFFLWRRYHDLLAAVGGIGGVGGGGLYALVQRFLSRRPNRARAGFLATTLSRYMLPLLATAALTLIALAVAALVFIAIDTNSPAVAWASVWGPVALIGIALIGYNANEVGLHSLYRSRLARAYLGAANAAVQVAAQNRPSTERQFDDLPMSELLQQKPLHLVCCAANDLGGNHLANLFRGARSATFSPFGFNLGNRYQPWGANAPPVSLATSMTASAAAFNSNMGSLSMELGGAATFLMTMFNARLGYWYRFSRIRRFFSGVDILDEMFSRTDSGAESQSIHLSDGGHFENLALYELLRRRCKYIIASDCGADEDVAFDDVGNALRRAREDFGVEVANLDLSVLKPNEQRYSRQHLAVGDIIYPGGDTGILLLFKPTLVGDEPGDVLQYRTRNLSFPHESTGDQFYDEKQWESYRRLGLHAARTAFHFMTIQSHAKKSQDMAEVFGEARWEWLPVPPALQDQLLARANELDSIEQQVMAANPALVHDLYPELWPNSQPVAQKLPPKDVSKLVPLFTQVIQLMEDVYVSCSMERYWSHPLNVGWTNVFGRWATTPLFREWWPLLSPMYNPRMARFIEEQFRLVSTRTATTLVGTVNTSPHPNAMALELWRAAYAKPFPGTPWTYDLRLESGQNVVPAAVVFVNVNPATGLVSWSHADFFVPPALWGARIGQAFLAELNKACPAIEVRLTVDPAHRKELSDTIQMYRQAGMKVEPGMTQVIIRK